MKDRDGKGERALRKKGSSRFNDEKKKARRQRRAFDFRDFLPIENYLRFLQHFLAAGLAADAGLASNSCAITS